MLASVMINEPEAKMRAYKFVERYSINYFEVHFNDQNTRKKGNNKN